MSLPFHRLQEFVPLTLEEAEIARSWASGNRRIKRGQALRREGDPVSGVFFLMEGWVGSSIMLRNGRRQIVKLHLPGDMLGFPSLALAVAGETLEAFTDAVICPIPNAALGRMFTQSPRLAAALFLSSQKERVALMQKLSWIGSTSAMERLAAFFLDLHDRLTLADSAQEGSFDFPITQQQLGDLLGLTTVHVNRSLKRLDQTGYLHRSRGRIFIRNLEGLRGIAPNSPPRFADHEAWSRMGRPSAI